MDEFSAIDPVRGYKRAWLTATKSGLQLRGVLGYAYEVEQEASCKRPPVFMGVPKVKNHGPAPHLDCKCGFYAWKDADATQKYYCANHSSVALEVDLYGRIIEHEHGYRAQYQRVLSIEIGQRCMWCAREPRFVCAVKADKNLRTICGECGPCVGRETLPLSHLSNLIGTEVRLPRTSPTPTPARPAGLEVPTP